MQRWHLASRNKFISFRQLVCQLVIVLRMLRLLWFSCRPCYKNGAFLKEANKDQSQHIFQTSNTMGTSFASLYVESRRKVATNNRISCVMLEMQHLASVTKCGQCEPPSENRCLPFNSNEEDDLNDYKSVAGGKCDDVIADFQVPHFWWKLSFLSWTSWKHDYKDILFVFKCNQCVFTSLQFIVFLYLYLILAHPISSFDSREVQWPTRLQVFNQIVALHDLHLLLCMQITQITKSRSLIQFCPFKNNRTTL